MTQGKTTIIDAADAEKVLPFKWTTMKNCKPRRDMFYARRTIRLENGKQKTVLLHRFILDAPPGFEVDHINGDSLDNRRCNLRLATRSQNTCNIQYLNNSTGFRGVIPPKKGLRKRFQAQIRCEGIKYWLGNHDTAEAAARAYDAKAIELHGEFAALNFPDEHFHLFGLPTDARMSELHSRAVAVAARMETERYYEAA